MSGWANDGAFERILLDVGDGFFVFAVLVKEDTGLKGSAFAAFVAILVSNSLVLHKCYRVLTHSKRHVGLAYFGASAFGAWLLI